MLQQQQQQPQAQSIHTVPKNATITPIPLLPDQISYSSNAGNHATVIALSVVCSVLGAALLLWAAWFYFARRRAKSARLEDPDEQERLNWDSDHYQYGYADQLLGRRSAELAPGVAPLYDPENNYGYLRNGRPTWGPASGTHRKSTSSSSLEGGMPASPMSPTIVEEEPKYYPSAQTEYDDDLDRYYTQHGRAVPKAPRQQQQHQQHQKRKSGLAVRFSSQLPTISEAFAFEHGQSPSHSL